MKFNNKFGRRCNHRRLKRNYAHGKKSTPTIKCKDCGKIITLKDLEIIRKFKRRTKKQKSKD